MVEKAWNGTLKFSSSTRRWFWHRCWRRVSVMGMSTKLESEVRARETTAVTLDCCSLWLVRKYLRDLVYKWSYNFGLLVSGFDGSLRTLHCAATCGLSHRQDDRWLDSWTHWCVNMLELRVCRTVAGRSVPTFAGMRSFVSLSLFDDLMLIVLNLAWLCTGVRFEHFLSYEMNLSYCERRERSSSCRGPSLLISLQSFH